MLLPGRDVLMLLPPDPAAPPRHIALRFPPLGPAVVAACAAPLGMRMTALDLVLEGAREPFGEALEALSDPETVEDFLAGGEPPSIEAAIAVVLSRIEVRVGRWSHVAVSVDRGSQTRLVAVLAAAIKRRWGAAILIGGVAIPSLRALAERATRPTADLITTASTPPALGRVLGAFSLLAAGRMERPSAGEDELVTLVRGGFRAAPAASGWPLPDFSIYDLAAYRRDPLEAEARIEGLAPTATLGPSLVLPYFFSFECQFSCAFCQTGGSQEAKPHEEVVRELATLAERHQTREFLFFDTQVNLLADALSEALIAAKLDLRWSDSLRVRPLEPGTLERMARAGCASITVGVESASERVLKSMVKGHRPEHATAMLREAHALEMLTRVNLLTCYPGETRAELDETIRWAREHAEAIDDLAPSAFYLTADSPIGRRPERYGVRVRGPRALTGATRFRKSPDSLAYDEVDGLTWEEREPMLVASEDWVRDAWREGRSGRASSWSPSTMLALRRRFATKAEIQRFLAERAGPRAARTPRHRIRLRPILSGRPSPGLVRVLGTAFERVRDVIESELREGERAHVILVDDGSSVFFRGTVCRPTAAGWHVRIAQLLGPPDGPLAADDRARRLTPGAELVIGAAGDAVGRAVVLSFDVQAAT